MGDYFQIIVDRDVTAEEAGAAGERIRDWLIEVGVISAEMRDCVLGAGGMGHPPGQSFETAIEGPDHHLRELWTNGLCIITGRAYFHSG